MENNRHSWIALSLVPGLGVATFWRLLRHFSSPAAVLAAPVGELRRIPGVREQYIEGLLQGGWRPRADDEMVRLEKYGGQVLVWGDKEYPQALTQLVDPPPVLYALGDLSLLQHQALAVVGSRAASSYGLRMAKSVARELARTGVVVVSGLAAGIDAAAHRGALSVGGTIAVLGCGLDRVYPRQNKDLYKEIAAKGLLLSEYPLATRPDAFRFPARNRIIAGISQGVVVVEAARKSGALITAQIALDYGREIFAVPGQMDSCKSEGCHLLIRSGAALVSRGADILDDLGIAAGQCWQQPGQERSSSAGSTAELLLQLLDSYPVTKDELIEKSGVDAQRLNEICLLLELDGMIESLPGERIRRIT